MFHIFSFVEVNNAFKVLSEQCDSFNPALPLIMPLFQPTKVRRHSSPVNRHLYLYPAVFLQAFMPVFFE